MNISNEIFAAYQKCPTKCFLRAHGEMGSGNEYADWVRTESESYRVEGLRRMTSGIPPGDRVTGVGGMENLKTAKWRCGVDYTAHAQKLESHIDAVERCSPDNSAAG